MIKEVTIVIRYTTKFQVKNFTNILINFEKYSSGKCIILTGLKTA